MIPESETLLSYFLKQYNLLDPSKYLHLPSSLLCNIDSSEIKKTARQLFTNLNNSEQKAQKAYNFIRNKILYSLDSWKVSASETLHKKSGMCFNKSNLMIALLREAKIPCLYSALWISKEAFAWMKNLKLYEKISPQTVHLYVEVYLGEKIGWRRYVETSMDPALRRALDAKGHRPFEHVLRDRPIERFSSAEEVLEWREHYKKELGYENKITVEEMEEANQWMGKLRKTTPRTKIVQAETGE